MPDRILYQSLWGSHAWRHNAPDADHDVFTIYQTSTRDILRRPSNERGRSIRNNDEPALKDEIKHEIGHVIQMLRGSSASPGPNVNYIVGLMSPHAILKTTPEAEALKKIVRDYPAKGVKHSAVGLADNNWKDMLNHRPGWVTHKKRRLIMRVLKLARGLIERGVYDFDQVKVDDDFDYVQIGEEFDAVRRAYEGSTMREVIPDDLLLDWLEKTRLDDLRMEVHL